MKWPNKNRVKEVWHHPKVNRTLTVYWDLNTEMGIAFEGDDINYVSRESLYNYGWEEALSKIEDI